MVTNTEEDLKRGYRVSKWKTYDNFECVRCQYSTLWIEKMQKHLQIGLHPWAYPAEDGPTLSKNIGTTDLEY